MTKKSDFEKALADREERLQEHGTIQIWNHHDSLIYYDHLVDKGLASCTPIFDGQILEYTWLDAPRQVIFILKT